MNRTRTPRKMKKRMKKLMIKHKDTIDWCNRILQEVSRLYIESKSE